METVSNLNFYLLFTLLLLSSVVAIVTKWIRLPYSIALVIVGLFIGVFHWLPVVTMTPELILLIFLPALLFEASWNLHAETLRSSVKPVAVLATVGVFLSALIVGMALHVMTGLDFKLALLFGAMLSATDPISVLSLFKRLRVNKRLHTVLEGESLLNDGTAVALFRVLLASIVVGADLSWTRIGIDFLIITAGGTLVGAAIGMLASKVTEYFDDHLLETTLTVLVAYGSYLLAEQLRVSSVIGVLVAGFIMGNFGSKRGMSAATRLAVDSFWEYAAFIAESLVFLLIGMQIKFPLLVKYWPFIAAGIAAILIARIVIIYSLIPLVSDKNHPIPLSWRHLLFWGGLRGSLCMAMALSLPSNFPERELLVVTTFGVALFTLLVPGLTMEPLVKGLKLAGFRLPKETALQNHLEKLKVEKSTLQRSAKEGKLSKKEFLEKIEVIETKERETGELIELLESSEGKEDLVERLQIEGALARAQKDCLVQLSRQDSAKPELLEEFRQRIDTHYVEVRGALKEQDFNSESESIAD